MYVSVMVFHGNRFFDLEICMTYSNAKMSYSNAKSSVGSSMEIQPSAFCLRLRWFPLAHTNKVKAGKRGWFKLVTSEPWPPMLHV